MNGDFAPFELAVKLKEKGYPQRTFGEYDMQGACYIEDGRFYENGCITEVARAYTSPTIAQVLKWLRKKKIVVSILPTGYNKETGLPNYYYVIYDAAEYFWKKTEYPQSFETWEECELSAIEYVLDNLI